MIEKIPVLDLKNSIAVSGKSGMRDTYTPLQTVYSSSPNPIEIANSLKLNGAQEIYIADLDLIEKEGHNIDSVKMINHLIPVMFDGGIKNIESFKFYLEFAYKLIIATETLESIDDLYEIFKEFPKERIVVSVDIKDNKLYSKNLDLTLTEFKKVLKDINPNEIILLDISKVGTQNKFNEDILNEFEEFKDKLIIGGGLDLKQVENLSNKGIKKVLVGTSLHNGEIPIR